MSRRYLEDEYEVNTSGGICGYNCIVEIMYGKGALNTQNTRINYLMRLYLRAKKFSSDNNSTVDIQNGELAGVVVLKFLREKGFRMTTIISRKTKDELREIDLEGYNPRAD